MSNEWFFEKFALIADAPGAVERMRELVLQLAVTGKLVRQDQNDEPASELIKNALSYADDDVTTAQRDRDNGRWKIVVDSGLSELPLGWTWTCNAMIGNTSPRVDVSDDARVAFVPMNLIPKDYRETLSPEIRLWKEIKRGYTHFADGDIVVAKITPCFQNGKACVMKDLPGGVGAGTTELHVLRPVPNTVIPLYMLLIFKSPEFVNGGVNSFTGTAGQQRVSTDYFRYCPIPLPPLAEQKRIVAKVDELMVLCDELEGQQQERELRKSELVRSSLSRFAESPTSENLGYLFHNSYDIPPSELRKSILTLAVQGKLVPQDPKDEPAEELISRVTSEKARLVRSKEIKNEPPLDPITEVEVFSIPKNWVWCRAGAITRPISSGSTPEQYVFHPSEGIPYLKVYNIRNQNVDFRYKPQFISISHHREKMKRSTLFPGDVVMNIVGPPLGKVAIIPDSFPEWNCNQAISFFRPIFPDLAPWIYTFLKEGSFLKNIQLIGTAGQDNISVTKCKFIPIAIPPILEQRRIVAKVDQLMALVDELERQQAATREKSSDLLDAIVHEMTSGG
jgi:type I restriction enzyme S subunit